MSVLACNTCQCGPSIYIPKLSKGGKANITTVGVEVKTTTASGMQHQLPDIGTIHFKGHRHLIHKIKRLKTSAAIHSLEGRHYQRPGGHQR